MNKNKFVDLVSYEREKRSLGFKIIAGVDEAGRGPLAGPVCAAAVILPDDADIPGLNDSKKLSKKKRESLFDIIEERAISYGIAFASHEEIDQMNILNATFLAMSRAINQLTCDFDIALIDGNSTGNLTHKSESVVGGDGKCMSIAAASILAKVTRDRLMVEYGKEYPGYGFEKHKGYGTKAHYEAIRELGVCPIHRLTFLKKMH